MSLPILSDPSTEIIEDFFESHTSPEPEPEAEIAISILSHRGADD